MQVSRLSLVVRRHHRHGMKVVVDGQRSRMFNKGQRKSLVRCRPYAEVKGITSKYVVHSVFV